MDNHFSSPPMVSKTPISLLQELCAKKGESIVYTLIHDETGSHNPRFIYQARGMGKTANGEGSSKKEAKHAAAKKLYQLVSETAKELEDTLKNPYENPYMRENAVGALQSYCAQFLMDAPKYVEVESNVATNTPDFIIKCCVKSFSTEGKGRSKQQAKHLSAYRMLQKLKDSLDVESLSEKENIKAYLEAKQNEAIEKLCQRFDKEISLRKGNQGKVSHFDYNNLFKQEKFVASRGLREIRGKSEDYFNRIKNPVELFGNIMKQIDLEWEISSVPIKPEVTGKLCSIQIRNFANATYFGMGKDDTSAFKAATLSALKWFSVMCS